MGTSGEKRLYKFRKAGGRLNLLGWRKAKNVEELLESLMCRMGKGYYTGSCGKLNLEAEL
jgi:hypothetical protein